MITPADTDDVQVATLAYGLGNWHLIKGDKAQARLDWFRRSGPRRSLRAQELAGLGQFLPSR